MRKKTPLSKVGKKRSGRAYLVYVGLFFCKVKFAETLVLDTLEEIVPEEFFDEDVFEGFARGIRGGQSIDIIRVE